jgi:hypothetical protein
MDPRLIDRPSHKLSCQAHTHVRHVASPFVLDPIMALDLTDGSAPYIVGSVERITPFDRQRLSSSTE